MAVAGNVDARREGPSVFEGDSWDPSPWADESDDPYRGTRRAPRPRRVSVLLGLGAVALVGWLAGASAGSGTRTLWTAADAPPTPALLEIVGPSAEEPSQVASAQAPVPAVTPADPSDDAIAPPPVAGPGSAAETGPGVNAPSPTAAPVMFVPVTYEAEAGAPTTQLRGSAQVVAVTVASGGRAVQGVGNWGGSDPGSLQFRSVSVPTAGTYRLTVAYVPEDARTAILTVSGAEPVTIAFPAGTGCCVVTTVDIALTAGSHTVTLTNPIGRVPLIDRLVLDRP
jgi:Carbohydrate binding module (family 35)